jgi:hypothetical protein
MSGTQLVRVSLFEFNMYASNQRYSFGTNQHGDQYEMLTAGASHLSLVLPDIVGHTLILWQPCKAGLEPQSNQANVSIILDYTFNPLGAYVDNTPTAHLWDGRTW